MLCPKHVLINDWIIYFCRDAHLYLILMILITRHIPQDKTTCFVDQDYGYWWNNSSWYLYRPGWNCSKQICWDCKSWYSSLSFAYVCTVHTNKHEQSPTLCCVMLLLCINKFTKSACATLLISGKTYDGRPLYKWKISEEYGKTFRTNPKWLWYDHN